jgi:hypothetical protein
MASLTQGTVSRQTADNLIFQHEVCSRWKLAEAKLKSVRFEND